MKRITRTILEIAMLCAAMAQCAVADTIDYAKSDLGRAWAAGIIAMEGQVSNPVTNTPPAPPTPQSFVGSVESYFTSHDSTLTPFVTDRLFAWTGAEYVSGVTTANIVGLDYDLWKSASLTTAASNYATLAPTNGSPTVSGSTFGLGAIVRNEGIAGTVMSGEAGGEYSLISGTDTKLTGFLNGGYEMVTHKGYVGFGARVMKALSTHTYAGIGLELRSDVISLPPSVSAFAGASF